jgi:hypothetical protein
VGVNKISATSFYHRLREIIRDRLAEEAGELAGEVEVDEICFGLTVSKTAGCETAERMGAAALRSRSRSGISYA